MLFPDHAEQGELDLSRYSNGLLGAWLDRPSSARKLDVLLTALLHCRAVKTRQEAITILAEVACRYERTAPEPRVALYDLGGYFASTSLREIRRILNYHPPVRDTLHRNLGTQSHLVVERILQGRSPARQTESVQQISLWGSHHQLALFGLSSVLPDKDEALKMAEELVEHLGLLLLSTKSIYEQYQILLDHRGRLVEVTLSLYGAKHVLRYHDKAREDPYSYLLYLLTLLCWCAAAVAAAGQEEVPVYFTEVKLRHDKAPASAGSADLVEVIEVNGEPLTPKQRKQLRLAAAKKYQSIGHLIREVEALLGGVVKVAIRDLKFIVGDGTDTKKILSTDESIRKPVTRHRRQLEDYIAASRLDVHDWLNGTSEIVRAEEGELIYFLGAHIANHSIVPAEEEVVALLQAREEKVQAAKKRAQLRMLENALSLHVLKKLRSRP